MNRPPKPTHLPPIALLFLVLCACLPLHAATLTVINGNDAGPGSLREAIAAAQTGDTIDFAPAVTNVILSNGELVIDKELSIDGGGTVTLRRDDAAPRFRLLRAGPGPAVIGASMPIVLRGLVLENGDKEGNAGGAIYLDEHTHLTVEDSRLEGNRADSFGGAINIAATAKLTLQRSQVIGNHAGAWGGGISIPYGGQATIDQSLFRNNHAGIEAGAIQAQSWVSNDDGLPSSVQLLISNSTFTGNSAPNWASAISLVRTGDRSDSDSLPVNVIASLINESVVDNAAVQPAVRTWRYSGIGDIILSTGNSLYRNDGISLIGDEVHSLGHNLLDDDGAHVPNFGATTGDLLNVDPMLDTFDGHVFVPLAASPAIDAGDDSLCTPFDQRGVMRPQGDHCDIGAAEAIVDFILTVAVTGNGQVSAAATPAPSIGIIQDCGPDGIDCAANYPQHSQVTLEASPAPHHHFSGWGGDCSGTGFSTSVVLDDDRTCTASFAINQYEVLTQVTGSGNISPSSQLVDHGDSASFTLTPASGWAIASVSGCDGTLVSDTYTTGPITAACTVHAQFELVNAQIFADGFED